MLLALLKDLRISKLRTLITGFSMFVGIVAVIASVMVGVLGLEYLEAVNARMSGWAPSYQASFNLSPSDQTKLSEIVDKLLSYEAMEISNASTFYFASLPEKMDSLSERQVYQKLAPIETKIVSDEYAKIFNLSSKVGSWFDPQTISLSLVLNQPAATLLNTKKIAINTKSTLALTPFHVQGIVDDGDTEPKVYLRILDLIRFAPHLLSVERASLYTHRTDGASIELIRSRFQDLIQPLYDADLQDVRRMDQMEAYKSVVSMIQFSLLLSAVLLLFVSILGQINIGLASLEQRTRELLIRRSIGASSRHISLEIFLSTLLVSVIVSLVAILFSVLVLTIVRHYVLADGLIQSIAFPAKAALAAVAAAIITGTIAGIIPAVKAAKLEPALVLR